MAAPAGAVQEKIRGLREAKAAFQALPERMRVHLNEATRVTLSGIVRRAKAHIQSSPSIETRALLNSIDFTLNEKNGRGRVGVSNVTTSVTIGGKTVRIKGVLRAGKGGSALTSHGASIRRPSRYAHLIEFGSRHQSAEPFMLPSARSQERPYLDRCMRAGKDVEQDLAAIGLRNL